MVLRVERFINFSAQNNGSLGRYVHTWLMNPYSSPCRSVNFLCMTFRMLVRPSIVSAAFMLVNRGVSLAAARSLS